MNRFGDAPASAAPASGNSVNRFGDSPASGGDQTAGGGLGTALQQAGVTNDNLMQQSDQEANAEIYSREGGYGLDPVSGEWKAGVKQPTKLGSQDKLAVIQAFRQKNHLPGPLDQSNEQMAAQVNAASVAGNTPLQNYAAAGASALANFGTGVVGAVAPKTAANMAQSNQQAYQYDPDSKAAFAGSVVGNTLPLVPAIAAGPGGVEAASTAAMGASAFGGVRTQVAQMRAAGHDVPVTNELMAAGVQALVMLGVSKLRLQQLQAVPGQSALLRDGVAKAISAYATQAGYQANDMMVMQLADNAIHKALIDPNTQLSSGVGEAGLMGAATGLVATPLAAGGEALRTPEVNSAIAPPTADQAMVKALQNEPAQQVQTPPAPSPLLDNAQPKVRVNEGDTSRGITTQFDDPIDKALYIASQPRKGKLAVEATKMLVAAGIPEEQIADRASAVKARVEQMAQGFTGDTIQIPKEQPGSPTPAQSTPAAPPTENQPAVTQADTPTQQPQGDSGYSFGPLHPDATAPDAEAARRTALERAGALKQTMYVTQEQNGFTISGDPPEAGSAGFSVEPTGKLTDFTQSPAGVNNEATAPQEAQGVTEGVAQASTKDTTADSQVAALPGRTTSPEFVKAAVQEAANNVKDFQAKTPANAEQAKARDAFRQRGVELVYYSGEGRGVRLARNADSVLFINRKNVAGDLHEAVAHEFLHELKATRPGLYQDFMQSIPQDQLRDAMDQYRDAYSRFKPGQQLSPAKLLEEGVATVFGKTARDGRVADAMMGKDPTIWQKVTDFVRHFTQKFSSKSKLVNQALDTFSKTMEAPIGGGAIENAGEPPIAVNRKAFQTTPSNRMEIEPTDAAFHPGNLSNDEDKNPIQKIGEVAGEIKGFLQRTFAPQTLGEGGKEAADTFREHMARMDLNNKRAEAAFSDASKSFDKMSKSDQWDFQSHMDDNTPQKTPELDQVAKAMYTDTNEGRKQLAAVGVKAAEGWQTEWWNRMWVRDPQKAKAMLDRFGGPGKLEGKAGFLKSQTIENWHDALAQGLVPKYDNPVDMFLATKAERNKYIGAATAMDELAERGSLMRFKDSKVPDGWVPIGHSATSLLKTVLPGEGVAAAPEAVAQIINNITTPSAIGGTKTFQMLQGVNNTLTQAALGLSGFHLRKVAQETINLNVARALDKTLSGDLKGAGKDLLRAPLSPATVVKSGKNAQDIMLGLKQATPEEAKVVDAMLSGGQRVSGDSIYMTKYRDRMQKALRQGGVMRLLKAGLNAPFALNEVMMQDGVMNYVQKAKLGLGYQMAQDVLAKLGPNASHDEIRSEMSKVSDHLDNVLGLMVRDNVFWNRTTRDLATLSTLSVGWNYGSGRALVGGASDAVNAIPALLKGKSVDTRRMSYLASTAALTALAGAATTYMTTGKGPQGLIDYIYPPSGQKDKNGRDIRLNTGFYTSDYTDFATAPLETLKNKASPLFHVAATLWANKDYFGTKVYNEDDAIQQKALSIAKYLGTTLTPFSVRQLVNTIQDKSDKSTAMKVLPFAGIKTAAARYSLSPAAQESQSIRSAEYPAGGRTQEQADKSAQVGDFVQRLKSGDESVRPDIRKAYKSGAIADSDIDHIWERTQAKGAENLVAGMQIQDAMKVWAKADPAERKEMSQAMIDKLMDSKSISVAKRRELTVQLKADIKALKE